MPDLYQEFMLYRLHSSLEGMHLGVNKTVQSLKDVCWWEGMKKDVENFINNCQSCVQVKNPYQRLRVPMQGQLAEYPLQTVSTDIAGPLPTSSKGNKWIIVFVEHFTKFCELVPMRNAKAETVAGIFVREWVCRYNGICENFLSDQGTNYMSEVMQQVNAKLEITQKRTTPYHPTTNGIAENGKSAV